MYKTRNTSSGDVFSYYTQGSDRDYSIQEIKNKINSSSIISPRFKLYILNPDETVKTEIPEKDILMGGSFNENYQNGQSRSLSVSLYNYNKKYSKIIKDNNDSHDIQYNYSKEYSKTNDYEEDHNEQYSYSEDYSKTNNIQVTSDEDYIESYVGKYYKYIKSQTISIYSLLFGEYYLLYRKMYTEGIIIIALNIIIACFNVEVSSLLTIIVRLFLAFKFKDIYLNKVEKKVDCLV